MDSNQNTKYIIKLTLRGGTTTKYLYRMYPKRLTSTRYAFNARTFKTEAEAQTYLNQHAANFGCVWEVIAYTPTASK